MTKEINYSPLFQFNGKSAEISFNLSHLHSTFNYYELEIQFRDTHLYLGDRINNLVWTLLGFDEIIDIIDDQYSGVVTIKLKNGFVAICESDLGMVDLRLDDFE